ncbi:MAG TPA: TIGR03013 family XrtA/PEP-CTERM system glycosyltransferase [Steroidobacteraceae bacterium]|nr:TIGR03013 family XrtA/PEP-CTERM system glycosyltransferase [Steroidobacteraceae bacterium]
MTIRIFRHYWQLALAVLAAAELLVFFFAPHVAALIRFQTDLATIEASEGPMWPRGLVFAGTMFFMMGAMGLYHARQRSRLTGLLARVAASVTLGSMVLAIVFYLVPIIALGRGVLLLTSLLAFGGVVLLRIVFDKLAREDIFKRRVLVFGSGSRAGSIAQLRRRTDRRGFTVVGYIPADGDDPEGVADSLRVKLPGSLLELCASFQVDEIVVAMDDRRRQFPMAELLECRLEGVEVTELVTFLERETGKVRLDVLNPSWMIFSEGFRQGRVNNLLERIFDVVASLALLAVTWPFMLLTAIAIKLEEGPGAPLLYGQMRVGQYGRPFRLLKFRSMRPDAESDGRARWADTNDPRVTRVGGFIRKVRIDELPQIINVLRGEMSFVGPRPERPEFVTSLNDRIPYYRERHTVKPGITGWAQLCYPYGSSEQDALEKLQYDLYYVKNHSLLFYIAILVQTVEVVLWGKGAR